MTGIRWPDEFRPEVCAVHAHNTVDADVEPGHVWAWLVRAPAWETWYPHCARLRIESGGGPDLEPGMRFTWSTLGVRVDTTVAEFEAPWRLAWRGTAFMGSGYHAWLIEPVAGGCRVTTEECQRGLLPTVAAPLLRRTLLNVHQTWLEALVRVARAGPPPA